MILSFLEDPPALDTDAAKVTLACAIQDAIEDELMIMRKLMEDAAS